MGNEESGPNATVDGDYVDQSSYVRMNADREGDDFILNMPQSEHKLGDYGFAGVWSIYTPDSISPRQRGGHFTVYSKELHTVFMGYGATQMQELFNDLWAFNFLTYKWEQIPLTGDVVTPRTGTRGVLVGNTIILFGGYQKPNYLEELHTINILTGAVQHIETTGDQPGPRSTPMVAYGNEKLYVWGGFNGQWPTTFHVLDVHSLVWSSIDPGISGRTGFPIARIGDVVYGYGSSKSGGFITLNTQKGVISFLSAQGQVPKSDVLNAGMVAVDQYLFFFGGRMQDKEYAKVYVYDSERNTWYFFPVVPDGETVNMVDGKVGKSGIFKLPKKFNYTFAYDDINRQLVASLGYPCETVMGVSIIRIADALAVMHLRSDMLSMLYK